MTDLAAVEACEQRLVNLWPALDTLLLGDWVVRCAHGYSGRANSASAVRAGARLADADIAFIADLFGQAGIDPAIRLTPLADPGIEERLRSAGWIARTRSIGMVASPCPKWRRDPAVAFAPTPPRHWLDGISRLQEPSKRNPAHLEAIVGRIRLPVAFATLEQEGKPLAYGMAAMDRGWTEIGSIMVHPEARGKGVGRRLVAALLGWAREAGTERIFLQVERSNAAAINLYRSLGFADLYAYVEYRLKA